MTRSADRRKSQKPKTVNHGPYLGDVGVTALAHTNAPVRERSLSYFRPAISGEIDAVVPYASVVVAQNALRSEYGLPNERAALLMQNSMEALRIHWYDGMREGLVRDGLTLATDANIDGLDGYYARVVVEEGVETELTFDSDFETVDGIEANVLLSPEEFAALNDFLGY